MRIIIKGVSTAVDNLYMNDPSDVIYIKNGRFAEPFEPDNQTQIIDATGKVIIPGLCDIHVHFRDPGLTHKEDIITGSKAAARGGFTTVCMMPNTIPPIDNIDTLKYVDTKANSIVGSDSKCREFDHSYSKSNEADNISTDDSGCPAINVLATSAMTIGQAGEKLCDFNSLDRTDTRCKEMTGHGIAGITEDGMTLDDERLMDEICIKAKELGLVIMDHAEPEIEIVKRDIALSRKYGCKIHIQHISKAETVELIRAAKAEGLAITAEAAPHHFALNEDVIREHGVNAKMNPPLASEKDRIAVLEGLLDGTIDIIATDHAPHSEDEKNVDFADAPNGIIGLETAFPIAFTTLVKSGLMSLDTLIDKMSTNPLKLIGEKTMCNQITSSDNVGFSESNFSIGAAADLAIVNIDNEYQIDKEEFVSKARNTPFHGMKVYGKVETTISNGKIVFNELNNEG